jgi:hypothetical protein
LSIGGTIPKLSAAAYPGEVAAALDPLIFQYSAAPAAVISAEVAPAGTVTCVDAVPHAQAVPLKYELSNGIPPSSGALLTISNSSHFFRRIFEPYFRFQRLYIAGLLIFIQVRCFADLKGIRNLLLRRRLLVNLHPSLRHRLQAVLP